MNGKYRRETVCPPNHASPDRKREPDELDPTEAKMALKGPFYDGEEYKIL